MLFIHVHIISYYDVHSDVSSHFAGSAGIMQLCINCCPPLPTSGRPAEVLGGTTIDRMKHNCMTMHIIYTMCTLTHFYILQLV